MSKSSKKSSKDESSPPTFKKIKKALLSIGVVGLIGLLADLLGFVSFCSADGVKIENQTNIDKQDNFVNISTYDNRTTIQNNSIDNSRYNTQVINQFFPIDNNPSEDILKVKKDISMAINYYNIDNLDLALEHINKYKLPPSGIDPAFFYTLKGNILFFRHNYDSSYYYHRLAFKIDKNSNFIELPKLKGLTIAYIHLKNCGYTLRDLKNIDMTKNPDNYVYDLGFKIIEIPNNGWFAVKNEYEEEATKLLGELNLLRPIIKSSK